MPPRLRVLHAIHDFLPRHQAGSELYAAHLAQSLQRLGHHVTILAATYDPARRHCEVVWRTYDGLPVVEVVNNWAFPSFESAWAPPDLDAIFARVLEMVDPDVLHVHNLLNLSLDLPAMARARGALVVATLHDYTLVCPSGGQRLHEAEQHVCRTIEPERCARCFRESPFQAQLTVGRALRAPGSSVTARAVRFLRQHAPGTGARLASMAGHVMRDAGPSPSDITTRLARARRAFEDFDYVVAPSPSLASEFIGLGFPAEKLHVADYGFSPLVPASRPQPTGPLRIGFVGTMVRHKGLHVLVEAIRLMPQGRAEALLFGDPETFPDYVTQLRQAAEGLPVRFMGRFEREATASIYAQMDVLVVPSLWLENSPLVIHEAFMTGVPVVGARIGGIADLITDGVNGLLYTPEAPAELARALGTLEADRGLLSELAARAPRVIPIDEDAKRWDDVYSRLAARRGQGVAAG